MALVTANQVRDSRQHSQIDQGPGPVQQLCQLWSCIPVWECLVHDCIWCSSRVCDSTNLVCHGRGLVAGKNCWRRHEWSVMWSTLIFSSGFLPMMSLFLLSLSLLLELLVPTLEMMESEAASLGLELNWQKTKVQALGSREDGPSTITVLVQEELRNLSIVALLSTQQLKALLISHVTIPSLVQLCKTWTIRSGS